MVLDKGTIVSIDWHRHTAKVKTDKQQNEFEVPLQFFGSSIFNQLDYSKFDILIVGDTYNDCVGILVYKQKISDGGGLM